MKAIFSALSIVTLGSGAFPAQAYPVSGTVTSKSETVQTADYVPCAHRCGMFEPRGDATGADGAPEAYTTDGQRPVFRQWRYPGDYEFASPPSYDEDASPLDNLLGGAASLIPR